MTTQTTDFAEVRSDLYDRHSAFHKPAYRYVRESDGLPPLRATEGEGMDALARVKLFLGGWTWYLVEYDPATGEGYGLACGHERELGYMYLPEMAAARGPFGLPMERDLHWTPRKLRDCA